MVAPVSLAQFVQLVRREARKPFQGDPRDCNRPCQIARAIDAVMLELYGSCSLRRHNAPRWEDYRVYFELLASRQSTADNQGMHRI